MLAVAAAWFFLAPQQLGGSTAYVTTFGTSMEPRFEAGDLVLVRQSDQYDVGDVAAYRSEELGGTVVLHRIAGRVGDGYAFKGDNNSWLDSERPNRERLVGRLWLHVPGAGRVLELRTPRNVAVLAGAAMLLLLGGGGGAAARRRRRRRGGDAPRPPRRPVSYTPVRLGQIVAAGSGLLLLASLGLAALAYGRPLTHSIAAPVDYRQSGRFAYSAQAPEGPVYEGGRVETGDPVYLRLVDRVDVEFHYLLHSDLPAEIHGTSALRAEVSSPNGWKRSLELQPVRPFESTEAAVRGTLRLDRIRALLGKVEQATGLAEGSYTVALVPEIEVRGTVAGAALETTYSPRLPFTLDDLQLRLQAPEQEPAETPGQGDPTTPLRPTEDGSIEVERTAPSTLALPKLDVSVESGRTAALAGGASALGGLLVALVLLLLGRGAGEAARIRSRYGQWLVPVARSHRRAYDEVVEVTSMEKLVELAQRYDRMILHEESDLGHSYRIAEEGILYVYLVGTGGLEPPLPVVAPEADAAPRSPDVRHSGRSSLGAPHRGPGFLRKLRR